MPVGHGVVQYSCARKIFCGECLLSGRGCALARYAELDFTLADLLVREERMVGGVVADESSNLSCGGLGPKTADDTEKKLMFAAQHSGSFVSSLRLAYHSVATPSIHRGRVTLNEGSLPGKG